MLEVLVAIIIGVSNGGDSDILGACQGLFNPQTGAYHATYCVNASEDTQFQHMMSTDSDGAIEVIDTEGQFQFNIDRTTGKIIHYDYQL